MVNTIQKLSFDKEATGGSIAVRVGSITQSLDPTQTPADNQPALDTLFGSGNTVASGDWQPGAGHGFTIEFQGAYSNADIPLIAFDDSLLLAAQTASTSVTATQSYAALMLIDFHGMVSGYTGTWSVGDWSGAFPGD
ncbi:MAG TPA: hypothetical protein VG713_11065, partial [Pirellulales bacterium]|nr:hypothetical protein [Pirellulales bacterium]